MGAISRIQNDFSDSAKAAGNSLSGGGTKAYGRVLTCGTCRQFGANKICLDSNQNMAYCASDKQVMPALTTCIVCPNISPYPSRSISQYPTIPMPSCIKPPPCLFTNPRCMIAEPAEGWCPITPPATSVTPWPTKVFVTKYPVRPSIGYPQ